MVEVESLDNIFEREKRVGGKLYNMTIRQHHPFENKIYQTLGFIVPEHSLRRHITE